MKNKAQMIYHLQETYVKVLAEKSAYRILTIFYKNIYKRVHIKDILLNTV